MKDNSVGRTGPYGFEEHIRNLELSVKANGLRTSRFSQAGEISEGDRIATGELVLESRKDDNDNDFVLLYLAGYRRHYWVRVPACIPIALLTEEDHAPEKLWHIGAE